MVNNQTANSKGSCTPTEGASSNSSGTVGPQGTPATTARFKERVAEVGRLLRLAFPVDISPISMD